MSRKGHDKSATCPLTSKKAPEQKSIDIWAPLHCQWQWKFKFVVIIVHFYENCSFVTKWPQVSRNSKNTESDMTPLIFRVHILRGYTSWVKLSNLNRVEVFPKLLNHIIFRQKKYVVNFKFLLAIKKVFTKIYIQNQKILFRFMNKNNNQKCNIRFRSFILP